MKHTLLIIMVLLSSLIFSQQREEIVERYSNGVKKSIVVYKGQGSKERLVKKLEYYENEKIKSSTDWKDGKPNGDFIEWYYNGQKEGEGTFKFGEKDGGWTYYTENENRKYEVRYTTGNIDLATFTDNLGQTYSGIPVNEEPKADGQYLGQEHEYNFSIYPEIYIYPF